MNIVSNVCSSVYTFASNRPITTGIVVVGGVLAIAKRTFVCEKATEAWGKFDKLSNNKKIAVVVGTLAIVAVAAFALSRKTAAPTVSVEVKVPVTSEEPVVAVVPVVLDTAVSAAEKEKQEEVLEKEKELADEKAVIAKKEEELAEAADAVQKKEEEVAQAAVAVAVTAKEQEVPEAVEAVEAVARGKTRKPKAKGPLILTPEPIVMATPENS